LNVFLSWSGDRSRRLAQVFNEWLPEMIQSAKPFFSPDDIEKGTNWFGKIAETLGAYDLGILFITRNNMEAPWIMFEAGALYKHIGQSHVCPLLFDDLGPGDLKGPLPLLNVTRFDRTDVQRLVQVLNATQGERALLPDVLQRTFDRLWPDLDERVQSILRDKGEDVEQKPPRSEFDLIQEILEISRSTSRNVSDLAANILGGFPSLTTLPSSSPNAEITLDTVFQAWPHFLKEAERISVQAALMMARAVPTAVSGRQITIAFTQRPNFEMMSLPKKKEFVRQLLAMCLNVSSLQVNFVLAPNVQSDPSDPFSE
jgi:hypothetical protein